jgi:hypothetical protein
MALTKIKSSGIAANAITENQITGNTLARILTAGNNIAIEANGRISSTATGGGSGVILLSNTTIVENFDIPVGQNGLSIGPVELADGANVTIAPGQRWLVL